MQLSVVNCAKAIFLGALRFAIEVFCCIRNPLKYICVVVAVVIVVSFLPPKRKIKREIKSERMRAKSDRLPHNLSNEKP